MAIITTVSAEVTLVNYWNFEEIKNEKIIPQVGHNSGILLNLGESTKIVSGHSGKAINITNNDIKQRNKVGGFVIPKVEFDFTKPFTITLNYFLNKNNNYRAIKDIIGCYVNERGAGFRFFNHYNRFIVRTGDGKNFEQVETNSSKTIIPADCWNFIAITYNGKDVTIFLNGKIVASKTMTLTKASHKNLYVGSYRRGFAYSMQGSIDNLKIYTGAMNEQELAKEYLNFTEGDR